LRFLSLPLLSRPQPGVSHSLICALPAWLRSVIVLPLRTRPSRCFFPSFDRLPLFHFPLFRVTFFLLPLQYSTSLSSFLCPSCATSALPALRTPFPLSFTYFFAWPAPLRSACLVLVPPSIEPPPPTPSYRTSCLCAPPAATGIPCFCLARLTQPAWHPFDVGSAHDPAIAAALLPATRASPAPRSCLPPLLNPTHSPWPRFALRAPPPCFTCFFSCLSREHFRPVPFPRGVPYGCACYPHLVSATALLPTPGAGPRELVLSARCSLLRRLPSFPLRLIGFPLAFFLFSPPRSNANVAAACGFPSLFPSCSRGLVFSFFTCLVAGLCCSPRCPAPLLRPRCPVRFHRLFSVFRVRMSDPSHLVFRCVSFGFPASVVPLGVVLVVLTFCSLPLPLSFGFRFPSPLYRPVPGFRSLLSANILLIKCCSTSYGCAFAYWFFLPARLLPAVPVCAVASAGPLLLLAAAIQPAPRVLAAGAFFTPVCRPSSSSLPRSLLGGCSSPPPLAPSRRPPCPCRCPFFPHALPLVLSARPMTSPSGVPSSASLDPPPFSGI